MTQDTVEQADTRRGKPCWYLASDLVSNAGVALNDASFVETGIYQLLKMHFKDKPYYVDVLELFHDVSNVCLTTLNLYSTHYNHHNTNNTFYIIYIYVLYILYVTNFCLPNISFSFFVLWRS
jgi:Polyprenyl synthetase.